MKSPRVLFVLKCREQPYGQENKQKSNKKHCLTSGLFNSATLVSEMLNKHHIHSKVVQVIDNNDIDREVKTHNPTHVMIEALWVVPEKFEILRKLYPNIKWIVRLHSEIPFIANEGIAIKWINAYLKEPNVYIAPNSLKMYKDLINYFKATETFTDDKIIYLPNYYERDLEKNCNREQKNVLDISCFGSIRPLKNQLIQAFAAIEYVKHTNKKLRFHINYNRIEQNGDPVLKNLRETFRGLDSTKYELVEHKWMAHEDFRKIVNQMDLCLQVSFNETFNITLADAVSQYIPVVASKEIYWISDLFKADTTDVSDIVCKIKRALLLGKFGTTLNKMGLERYNKDSVKEYLNFLKR